MGYSCFSRNALWVQELVLQTCLQVKPDFLLPWSFPWRPCSFSPELSAEFMVPLDSKSTPLNWVESPPYLSWPSLINLETCSSFSSRGLGSWGLTLQFLQHCQNASIFSLSHKKCLVIFAEIKLPGFLLMFGFWQCSLLSDSPWHLKHPLVLLHNGSCFIPTLNEDQQAFPSRTEWREGEKNGWLAIQSYAFYSDINPLSPPLPTSSKREDVRGLDSTIADHLLLHAFIKGEQFLGFSVPQVL